MGVYFIVNYDSETLTEKEWAQAETQWLIRMEDLKSDQRDLRLELDDAFRNEQQSDRKFHESMSQLHQNQEYFREELSDLMEACSK